MTIRDILNKHKWATNTLNLLEFEIIHRGAPNDKISFLGNSIIEIGSNGLLMNSIDEDFTFIPWHRILCIKEDGKIIWKR